MRRSPLHSRHEAAGARFVDFGGWEMPVQYDGVIAEHLAVRNQVGVFDVSHLGRFVVDGGGAAALLGRLFCNDAAGLESGRAQYTMALNEDGGVIDDIIVWRLAQDRYWVLPNGVNHDRILALCAGADVEITDHRHDTVMLAVQGPQAPDVVATVLGEIPRRFRLTGDDYRGSTVWVGGTGYTGERGVEIVAPAAVGETLWDDLVAAGARPCGLGSRDTLRLEMGYPLWGQDLDEATTPLEAGLGWVVDWEHDFTGKDALAAQRDGGLRKRLVGFTAEGRQIPRHDYPLRAGDASGTVTSGNYSPVLERGIGMGYLSPPPAADLTTVEIEIRGRAVTAAVVDPPFI